LVRVPVPEAIREVTALVSLHPLEVRVPVEAGSRSAENWHLVMEIGDRVGIVGVVVAAAAAVAIFQDSTARAGLRNWLRSNVLDH